MQSSCKWHMPQSLQKSPERRLQQSQLVQGLTREGESEVSQTTVIVSVHGQGWGPEQQHCMNLRPPKLHCVKNYDVHWSEDLRSLSPGAIITKFRKRETCITETQELVLELIKRVLSNQNTLGKLESREFTFPHLNTHYKASVIKMVCDVTGDRQIQKRLWESRRKLCTCGQLPFSEGAGQENCPLSKWTWHAGWPHEKGPEPHLAPHPQTNSKWTKDLSVTKL